MKCENCGFFLDRLQVGLAPITHPIPLVRDLRGERIHDYDIEDLIGIGTTGAVFRARSILRPDPVAFKVLAGDPARWDDFLQRFQDTAPLLANLNHPHIPRVLAHGVDGDLPYLVMPLIRGITLSEYLKSVRPSPQGVYSLLLKICSAVSYAHGLGVVHGDLRPSRIIFSAEHLHVLGFGLAQLVFGQNQAEGLVRRAAAPGNLAYLAPELTVHGQAPDVRSDIFSLGAIMYEMFTGLPAVGAFPQPSQVRKKLPAALDDMVYSCLNPDPPWRYNNVDQLIAALKNVRFSSDRRGLRLILVLLAAAAAGVYLWPRLPELQRLFNELFSRYF